MELTSESLSVNVTFFIQDDLKDAHRVDFCYKRPLAMEVLMITRLPLLLNNSVLFCAFRFQFHFTWLSVTHRTFSKSVH